MIRYLSRTEVAESIGVRPYTLGRYKLPPPDAMIGDTRGWKPATIDRWHRSRPSQALRGLKAEGRKLWRQIHRAPTFDDCPERLAILESACRTLDVINRLQAVIDEATDLRVKGSQGQPVSLPEIGEVRAQRSLFVSQMKALGLPDEEDAGNGNGLTRSQIGRLGAQARWNRTGAIR
jgi:hypothetical protein